MGPQVACMHHEGDSNKKERKGKENEHLNIRRFAKYQSLKT